MGGKQLEAAATQMESLPEGASAGAKEALSSITISQDGATVRISATIPKSLLDLASSMAALQGGL